MTTEHKYLPGYKQISHHEWRTAENSVAYLLPTLSSHYAANPSLCLLDVGTGPGTIAADFAQRIPNGHVTATDLSEEVLTKARNYCGVRLPNITFQQANVFSLPFEDESFDFVHTHQMLCHLHEPVKALKEMLRVTKKGGVLAVKEADLRMWFFYPELPALGKFHDMLCKTHEGNGASTTAGRQLVSWAVKAGAKRSQIKPSFGTACYCDEADRLMWGKSMGERAVNGEMKKKALAAGIIKEGEAEEMGAAWDEWMNNEEATFGLVNGEILVFK